MLATGTRLGPYEIVGALGAGGMGEVYKATDTRLNRIVAVKVLPSHIAADPLARERFEREAKIISSLDHPHICPLFDVGDVDGVSYLVMPCLEGETLAERLGRGALRIADTLRIAAQICDALDKAHRQGIVHRDLKPGNIFVVRRSGPPEIKLLDFGLAKSGAGGPGGAGGEGALTAMPTMGPSLTTPGTILGTFQYMSPEQIEGLEADARTDVFAFGAVVYEMATGKKAFEGRSQASVMAAILERDPVPMSSLAPIVPAAFERVVRKCLAKDPDARWQTARDLLDELRWIESTPGESGTAASAVVPVSRRLARSAIAAALAVTAAAIGAGAAWLARAPVAGEPIMFSVETPPSLRAPSFELSPDGRQLAYTSPDADGVQRLWVRAFASPVARVIPGTDQASAPFWSPDSRQVAFFTESLLKRVDVAAHAAPQTVCKTPALPANGGAWSGRNTILFARGNSGILEVSAAGGEPRAVTTVGVGESAHASPTLLPDGRHFVYLKIRPPGTEVSQLVWRELDGTLERVVRPMSFSTSYSPTGHLLFRLDGALVAQAFDPSSGTLSGDTEQIAPTLWAGAISLSSTGVLAYRASRATVPARLTWLDRDGRVAGRVGPDGTHNNITLDPKNNRVVFEAASDLWLLDGRADSVPSRLTFGATTEGDPVLSPDGRDIVFYSDRQPAGIYRRPSSGAGAEQLLAETGTATWPRDWSSDGRFLLYDSLNDGSKRTDVWVLPLSGTDRKPFPYLASSFEESEPHFSPDGTWVAYVSDESARRQEVFIDSFPKPGAKFQVSTTGGIEPRWSRDGRELYYLSADERIMAVAVNFRQTPPVGVAKPLFPVLLEATSPAANRYAVSADGQRFLMNVPIDSSGVPPITIVLNWPGLLKK